MARAIVIPAVILAVASAQTYQITKLPGNECSADGLVDIPTGPECEKALKSLAGAASILNYRNDAQLPAGCYVENEGGTPRWSTTAFNVGAGIPMADQGDFFKVCATPSPVTQSTSLPVTVQTVPVTQTPPLSVTVQTVPVTQSTPLPVTVQTVPVTQAPLLSGTVQTVPVTQSTTLPVTVQTVPVTQAPSQVKVTQAPATVEVTQVPTKLPTACPAQKCKLAAGPVDGMTCAEKFDKMFAEPMGPLESSNPDAQPLLSKCELTYAKLVALAPACAAAPARLFSTARGPVETGAGGFNVVVAGLAALVAVALAASIAGLIRKRRAPRPDEIEILVAEAREVA